MKPESNLPPTVSAEELLAYAEGMLTGAEHQRVQAAIFANRALFDQMQQLRQRIYQRLVLPELPSFVEALAALDGPAVSAQDNPTPHLAKAASFQATWDQFRQWCTEIAGEAVAAAEWAGVEIRSLAQVWTPVLSTSRLSRGAGEPPPTQATELHLEHAGNSLRIQPHEDGFEVTVSLSEKVAGEVRVLAPQPDAPMQLARWPGTRTEPLRQGNATVYVPCAPGTHRWVVEIARANTEPLRWACLIQRPG